MMSELAVVAEEHAVHGTHGSEGFEPSETILHHITNANAVEIPWFKHPYWHEVELPHIHVGGLDLSITKHVVMMWLVGIVLILLFGLVFRKRKLIPSGLANLLEMIVVFVRDEIALKSIGEKEGKKYVPYLLTVFFFILGCNILGLIPFGAKPTGNINMTGTMAGISFIVIQISGMIRYGVLQHFKNLIPPGIPWPLIPIMIPVEIMGVFATRIEASKMSSQRTSQS